VVISLLDLKVAEGGLRCSIVTPRKCLQREKHLCIRANALVYSWRANIVHVTRTQRLEKQERVKGELAGKVAQWNPQAESEKKTTDPFKTLFVSRIVCALATKSHECGRGHVLLLLLVNCVYVLRKRHNTGFWFRVVESSAGRHSGSCCRYLARRTTIHPTRSCAESLSNTAQLRRYAGQPIETRVGLLLACGFPSLPSVLSDTANQSLLS
jgi:hypothetical protein